MKKLLFFAALGLSTCVPAPAQVSITLSGLNSGSAVSDGDLIPDTQGYVNSTSHGTTNKITALQFKTYCLTGLAPAWSSLTGTPTTLAGYGITDAGNGVLSESISAASTVTLASQGRVSFDSLVLGAGSGAYTASRPLSDTGARPGDQWFVNVSWPASTNPTLNFFDNTTGGTALGSYAGTAAGGSSTLQFVFNGTSWTHYSKNEVPIRLLGANVYPALQAPLDASGGLASHNSAVNASNLTSGTLPHAQLPALVSSDIPNNGASTTGNAATASAAPVSGLTGAGAGVTAALTNALDATGGAASHTAVLAAMPSTGTTPQTTSSTAQNQIGVTTDLWDGGWFDGSSVWHPFVPASARNIYVSQAFGNDTRVTNESDFSVNHPFKTMTAAATASATDAATSPVLVVVEDGAFSASVTIATNVSWFLLPGVTETTIPSFKDASTCTGVTLSGCGQTIGGLFFTNSSTVTTYGLNFAGSGFGNTGVSYTGNGTLTIFGNVSASGPAYAVQYNPTAGGVINIFGNVSAANYGFYCSTTAASTATISGLVTATGGPAYSASSSAALNITVGSLVEGSSTSSGVGLTITSPERGTITTSVSPATGFTQAFVATPENQILYLTPSGTLAAGTVTFPPEANTRINDVLVVFSTQTITSFTASVSGGTIYGAPTTLGPGSVSFKKLAANTWTKL